MMLTFRAGKVAAVAVFLSLAACSREQQDWRAAEAADTVESYDQFLERHPDSELVTAARTRVAQLTEDREWSQAGSADTAEAYREFLAHHPNGKWAQEARIRIQNFALNGLSAQGAPQGDAPSTANASSAAPGPGNAGGAPTPIERASAPSGDVASPGESASAPTPASATLARSPNEPASSPAASAGELAQPAAAPPRPQLGTPYVSTPRQAETVSRAPGANTGSVAAPTPAFNPAPVANTAQAANTAQTAVPGSAPGAYGVQLGAFTSETGANVAWQQLTTRFGAQLRGLSPHLVPANTTSGTLFRLQAQVPDESAARALCDMLKQQAQACVPVLPH